MEYIEKRIGMITRSRLSKRCKDTFEAHGRPTMGGPPLWAVLVSSQVGES